MVLRDPTVTRREVEVLGGSLVSLEVRKRYLLAPTVIRSEVEVLVGSLVSLEVR